MWTKGKIEKAWRVFNAAAQVIADALEVDVLELKALILEGTVPPYDRGEPTIMEAQTGTMEADSHVKRATLADLAPVAETVLEKAAPIIEKPLRFRPTIKPRVEPSRVHTSLDDEAAYMPAGVDRDIERSGERVEKVRPHANVHSVDTKRRAAPPPPEFYLMHEGKYLHESCSGLTDKREFAWRQVQGKIAAVRRKFPETVDYLEVPANER